MPFTNQIQVSTRVVVWICLHPPQPAYAFPFLRVPAIVNAVLIGVENQGCVLVDRASDCVLELIEQKARPQ